MSGGICLLLVSSAATDATCMMLQWLSVLAYVSTLCSRAIQGYSHTADTMYPMQPIWSLL